MLPSLLVSAVLAFAHLELTLAANVHAARHDIYTHRREEQALAKRGGSRMTWFDVGMGACGRFNTPDRPVIAISKLHWDGGSHCFEQVTIQWNGQTRTATVVDECMGCPYDAIDLSKSLFASLADPIQVGTIYGSWSFGGGGGGGGSDDSNNDTPTTKPKPIPKPTPTTTKPSTTWTPPTTTSSKTASTSKSTSSTTSTTSTTRTSTTSTTSTSSSTTAQPTATFSPDEQINQLRLAYAGLMGLVLAA